MTHSSWKAMFSPHIWQRGKDYYLEDRVLDIRYHGNCITAEVEGTDVYEVTLTINPKTEKLEDYYCDCPYGEDGTPCKHLAAVLCALEEDDRDAASSYCNDQEITVIVNRLSEQQMRELLLQLAKDSSDIREKVTLAALGRLPKNQKEQWEQDLQELTDNAADRYGYIDYEEAYDYCFSLREYLEDRLPNLLSCGLTMDAFELVCLVFQTGIEQDMDDSDGGLSILAGCCMDAWSEILESADVNIQQNMLGWFIAHYSDYDLSRMFLEDYIYGAPWKTEIVSELLQFLDQQITGCLHETYGEYRLEHLIVSRVYLMKQTAANKPEIEKYLAKYHHLPAVRNIEIEQAYKAQNWETALALLDESRVLDQDKIGLVAQYSARIMEIHEITNDAAAFMEELEHYLFAFRQDDLTYVDKMKAHLTPEAWNEMCSRLLESPTMTSQVYPLLEQEDMLEQLMERIVAHADIHALERYEAKLKKLFPEQCRNVYITYVRRAMAVASNRKAYWSVVQTLKKLRKYPEGKESAQRTADSWKQDYPRRTAMLDELRKAGF